MNFYINVLKEKGQSFPEFVWRCARAFTPCANMRDQPIDILPKLQIEANHDYIETLRIAQEELAEFKSMSIEERVAYAGEKIRYIINFYKENKETRKQENERLYQMQEQVLAWEPPSEEYNKLQKFMLEMIKDGINIIIDEEYEKHINAWGEKDARQYAKELLSYYQEEVDRHKKRVDEEEKTNKYNSRWLTTLNESVPQPIRKTNDAY